MSSNINIKSTDPILNDSCSICLESFKEGGIDLARTKCNHIFHRTCLMTHAATSNGHKCPLCRQLISPISMLKADSSGTYKQTGDAVYVDGPRDVQDTTHTDQVRERAPRRDPEPETTPGSSWSTIAYKVGFTVLSPVATLLYFSNPVAGWIAASVVASVNWVTLIEPEIRASGERGWEEYRREHRL